MITKPRRHTAQRRGRVGRRLAGDDPGHGLPAKIVVEKIKKAQTCAFDTSREALKVLRAAGVSDSVIVAMVRA